MLKILSGSGNVNGDSEAKLTILDPQNWESLNSKNVSGKKGQRKGEGEERTRGKIYKGMLVQVRSQKVVGTEQAKTQSQNLSRGSGRLRCMGSTVVWIEKSLTHRRQRVLVEECYAGRSSVTSGCLQGPVLAILLFVIHITIWT